LDGFQVLAKFKEDPALREIPIIMLSALDEENGIARSIEMGVEDYLAKPFNPVFLRARIGACLEKKRLRDKEKATHQALLSTQKHLAAELAGAAAYVRSLLPAPLTGAVQTEWCFQPSEQLGGDAFGYHWLDAEHLAIYLLDVCGHGVGAALLSVSVMSSLRLQTLPGTDFHQPSTVLCTLNRAFRTEDQHHLFFSMWYGVYCVPRRELCYASGGHHPALLLALEPDGQDQTHCLSTEAPAIGCFDDARFSSALQPVPSGARLLVFSDGVFEVFQGADRVGTWQDFLASFSLPEVRKLRPTERLDRALKARGADTLEDDFSCWSCGLRDSRRQPFPHPQYVSSALTMVFDLIHEATHQVNPQPAGGPPVQRHGGVHRRDFQRIKGWPVILNLDNEMRSNGESNLDLVLPLVRETIIHQVREVFLQGEIGRLDNGSRKLVVAAKLLEGLDDL